MKIIKCEFGKTIKSIDDLEVIEIFEKFITTSKTGSMKIVFPQGGIKYINTNKFDTYTLIPCGDDMIMVFSNDKYDVNRIKQIYLSEYYNTLNARIIRNKEMVAKTISFVKKLEMEELQISHVINDNKKSNNKFKWLLNIGKNFFPKN